MTWSDIENRQRLHLATRLHGAAMPVIETMLTPRDGAVSIRDLHYMCGVAERVERAADNGPDDELFLDLLSVLMQRTAEVREYVDDRLLDGRYKASDLVVLRDIKKPDAPLNDDWTPDDDRAVAAGQVAELLDAMSAEQIERVRAAAQEILKS